MMMFFVAGLVFGQESAREPSLVTKATYFDVSPPLREMTVVLPGERDRSWKDGVITNFLDPMVSDEVRTQFKGVEDPVLQNYMGAGNNRGPVRSFDGVGNVNSVYPPDTDGDVGIDHYFQMINLSFAIWDKQGNKLFGPVDNSTLWAGFVGPWTGTNDGDPVVLYDEIADRWIATQFAIHTSNGTYWELIAISKTGDPLGNYYRYAFQFPAFNDYPHFGVWPDAYYASFNMFGSTVRGGVAAFERDKMLEGDPDAQMVYYDMWSEFSMLPADLDGPPPPEGTPHYFAHLKTWGSQDLEIFEFDVDWENVSNSSITKVASLNTDPFNPDVNGIKQPGTTQRLSTLSDRLMFRVAYRSFDDYEVMLTNHTVQVGTHAGVRWYEMRKETGGEWYMYQQGTYSPDSDSRWMGSIAMNAAGEIALGYTVSSSSVYPSVRYTGRSPEAPLGEMNYTERELVEGTGSQSGINRWGDYSCMSVDPVDDSFWFTQEYMRGGWKTRIGNFDFGPVLPPEINAGTDTLMCENTLFVANAEATYVSSVFWETDGDGRFVPDPPIHLIQGYIRGVDDIEDGGFTLSVIAEGFESGMQDYDTIVVQIIKLPHAFAGNDTTVPQNASVTLNGQASNQSTVEWTTEGDGIFDDPAILNATYTPGDVDIAEGTVRLMLTANPLNPCEESDTDKINVTLDPTIGIDQMDDKGITMQVVPNPSSGEFSLIINGQPEQKGMIKIHDQSGKVLYEEVLDANSVSLNKKFNLSSQPKGIYFVSVRYGDFYKARKVIIQ